MPKPLLAIVGRPNVGKSAMFNRLARRRIAIVEDFAGTTRDRLYTDCEIWNRPCTLIDTGGFDPLEKEGYTPAILSQTQFAIDEADILIFMVDGRVCEAGTPDEMFRNPQQPETKQFLRFFSHT